ncbi:hypothetical protein FQN57_001668 [Myotisia sp. PD_48]|nr:hypothetical protein FQN57_001668 [Myotisia sp. PD_48]
MTVRKPSHTTPCRFKPTVIIHGGAGNITRKGLPPELYEKYRSSLLTYLRSTYDLLSGTDIPRKENQEQSYGDENVYNTPSSALNAAVHAVSLMEDDELFNCGRGSVFTRAGTIEMEASVMVCSICPNGGRADDHTPECHNDSDVKHGNIKRGAGVMMVRNVRHPIHLAREVLLRNGHPSDDDDCDTDGVGESMHSQLCGPYVETLAKAWGLEFKHDEWFYTERRWKEHKRGLKGKASATLANQGEIPRSNDDDSDIPYLSQGTVGCICLDQWGNLAVATSTGGMTNKFPGRIGDTPTLGAGFWAEAWDAGEGPSIRRRGLAVSGTGNGDSFLRTAAAHTVASLVRNSRAVEVPLIDAITAVSGPGGELQRSAGPRWDGKGEGVGGMIGIEVAIPLTRFPHHIGDPIEDNPIEGIVISDFNGGGMFRAWMEKGSDGQMRERMMVFREEYYK